MIARLLLSSAFSAAALTLTSHAAVIYEGFGSSTEGAVAPDGWTRIENTGNSASSITAENHFLTTTTADAVAAQFNTGTAISRTEGNGFRMTVAFRADSASGQHENTSFSFFTASGSSSVRVVLNMGSSDPGRLEFSGVSSQTFGFMADYNTLETENPLYTLVLDGIFNASGALALTANLSNSFNSATATATATWNSPAANNYFGIRTASGGTGGATADATFESFRLETIPEPSSALLLLGGAMATLARRRRRG